MVAKLRISRIAGAGGFAFRRRFVPRALKKLRGAFVAAQGEISVIICNTAAFKKVASLPPCHRACAKYSRESNESGGSATMQKARNRVPFSVLKAFQPTGRSQGRNIDLGRATLLLTILHAGAPKRRAPYYSFILIFARADEAFRTSQLTLERQLSRAARKSWRNRQAAPPGELKTV